MENVKCKRTAPSSPFGELVPTKRSGRREGSRGRIASSKWLSVIAVFFLLTSCWPTSVSFFDISMPEDWKDFYITPLEMNVATAPTNYNSTLTESLRTGVQNNTRLKMLTDVTEADVQISGVVTSYNTTPQAITEGDNAQKNRLTVSVSFTIITPTKGLEKMQMTSTRFADYDASQQLSDVEAQLLEIINQQVVQDLINKLRSNW
jgi:outer membrane lipopolysaccharide assembly protein LptE/RlpB